MISLLKRAAKIGYKKAHHGHRIKLLPVACFE